MGIKDCIKKFKLLFDWTVVDVAEPVAIYRDYRDKGQVLLGYNVSVTYKHHGVQNVSFFVDDKFGLLTAEIAKKRAECFALKQKSKIKQR